MPRIPQAPAAGPEQGGLAPPSLAAAPFAIAADALGEQADALFRARAAEAEAMRKTQLATQSAAMVSALNARQVEAQDHDDANTIVENFGPAGNEDIQGILDNTPDDIVRGELLNQSQEMLVDYEFNLTKIQRGRQKRDYLTAFPGIIKTYTDGIALAIDEGNPEQAESLRESARLLIAESPHHTGGQIAANIEALDTRIDAEHGWRMLQSNPNELLRAMDDPQRFTSMGVDDRIRFQNSALLKQDRAERDATKAADAREEEIYKEALLGISDGEFLPSDLDAIAPILTGPHLKILIDRMDDPDDGENDVDTVIEIENMIDDNDDAVLARLDQAFRSGEIDESTYRSQLGDARSLVLDERPAKPYKAGRVRIKSVLSVSPSSLQSIRNIQSRLQSEALEEFRQWRIENADAEPLVIDNKADEIIDRFAVLKLGEMVAALPLPRGFSGNKRDITSEAIGTAVGRLNRDLESGAIPIGEYTRENQRLAEWISVLQAKRSAAESQGARK